MSLSHFQPLYYLLLAKKSQKEQRNEVMFMYCQCAAADLWKDSWLAWLDICGKRDFIDHAHRSYGTAISPQHNHSLFRLQNIPVSLQAKIHMTLEQIQMDPHGWHSIIVCMGNHVIFHLKRKERMWNCKFGEWLDFYLTRKTWCNIFTHLHILA